MEKLIGRKDAARILGISLATLDAARNNGLIAFVQYVPNGCVYFTEAALHEYVAKCTHRPRITRSMDTYRNQRKL
ncbi:MAG: DNA-binding protein [Clostridia bacterium]|nr:DNA-binding protein [Clostridia bacterium]